MSSVVVDPSANSPPGHQGKIWKPMVSRQSFANTVFPWGAAMEQNMSENQKNKAWKNIQDIRASFRLRQKASHLSVSCWKRASTPPPSSNCCRTTIEELMKYFPCPRWKLWNISGRKVHGRHVRMKGKSWKGLQLSQGQAAAADCIEDSHGGGELKISYGMPPRPPQQMWQTPYPESCDSPLRGARLKGAPGGPQKSRMANRPWRQLAPAQTNVAAKNSQRDAIFHRILEIVSQQRCSFIQRLRVVRIRLFQSSECQPPCSFLNCKQ